MVLFFATLTTNSASTKLIALKSAILSAQKSSRPFKSVQYSAHKSAFHNKSAKNRTF